MRGLCSLLALSLALSASPFAFAQAPTMESSSADLQAAQAQAQADAIHPGDDDLTCDQIQAEMATTMNSQEVRTNTAEMGETARAQQQRAHDMQGQMAAQVGVGMVTGVISSFVPGAGYAQQAIVAAQMRQQQAQAAQGQQEMSGMMGNMSAMMPQMMRGQRLYQLADAKHCEFMQQMQEQAPH